MSHSTSTVICAVILQFCKSGIKTSPDSIVANVILTSARSEQLGLQLPDSMSALVLSVWT